jgi:hypothetical protein
LYFVRHTRDKKVVGVFYFRYAASAVSLPVVDGWAGAQPSDIEALAQTEVVELSDAADDPARLTRHPDSPPSPW